MLSLERWHYFTQLMRCVSKNTSFVLYLKINASIMPCDTTLCETNDVCNSSTKHHLINSLPDLRSGLLIKNKMLIFLNKITNTMLQHFLAQKNKHVL